MDLPDEESEWEHLNRTNWHGLGLTDPVKNVEVRTLLHGLASY